MMSFGEKVNSLDTNNVDSLNQNGKYNYQYNKNNKKQKDDTKDSIFSIAVTLIIIGYLMHFKYFLLYAIGIIILASVFIIIKTKEDKKTKQGNTETPMTMFLDIANTLCAIITVLVFLFFIFWILSGFRVACQ